jgi:undecaprenyl phosphate-alpha-L-ara4FN deformylase
MKKKFHAALSRGFDALAHIIGKAPSCSAVPGWIANDTVLCAKEHFPFTYNSDCRGQSVFLPSVSGTPLKTPQIPVTLPTYDEIIGQNNITRENYNDHLLSQIRPDALNVLTIHAEVEGIVCLDLFEDFIKKAVYHEISMVPLGQFLKQDSSTFENAAVTQQSIPGREGRVAIQASYE